MSKTNIILWQRQAASVYIQRNTPYTVGDVALSTKLEDLYLKCTGTGTTGGTEPDWTSSDNDVTDGTAKFALVSDMLKAYPVGCFYESTVSTNPRQLFGGVWTEDTTGRVLISRSSSIAAGTLAGEATHTLTVAELPVHTPSGTIVGNGSHTHTIPYRTDLAWTDGSTNAWLCDPGTVTGYSGTTGSSGSHSHTFIGNSIGSGSAHNNMQPYQAVYRWYRTA